MKVPGLNAVGKPYGANYDPKYKLRYKPNYGHLRAPYGPDMRFVGDPPKTAEDRRFRYPQLRPLPLLDSESSDALAQRRERDRLKTLRDIKSKLHALSEAIVRHIEKVER